MRLLNHLIDIVFYSSLVIVVIAAVALRLGTWNLQRQRLSLELLMLLGTRVPDGMMEEELLKTHNETYVRGVLPGQIQSALRSPIKNGLVVHAQASYALTEAGKEWVRSMLQAPYQSVPNAQA